MSAARMAKDQQVVEAVLRDKDPGWFRSRDNTLPSTALNGRRVGVRTTRRVVAKAGYDGRVGEPTMSRNRTVKENRIGPRVTPPREAPIVAD